ncbi:MAG: preprotein translocase subunit SecG [Deltaproteobacteria bacterium]
MAVGKIILTVIHILMAISLIVIVLLQSGKSAGLSGSIAGAAETFMGKKMGRNLDSILSKWTTVAAVVFLITSIILSIMSINA